MYHNSVDLQGGQQKKYSYPAIFFVHFVSLSDNRQPVRERDEQPTVTIEICIAVKKKCIIFSLFETWYVMIWLGLKIWPELLYMVSETTIESSSRVAGGGDTKAVSIIPQWRDVRSWGHKGRWYYLIKARGHQDFKWRSL